MKKTKSRIVNHVNDAIGVKHVVTYYKEVVEGESKKRSNFCQRFMAQIEEGYICGKIPSKTDRGISDNQMLKIYDMSLDQRRKLGIV